MSGTNITSKSGYTESEYTENKKLYQKMEDSKVIHIRLNTEQRIMLDRMKDEEDFVSTSVFVKYKLFGLDPAGDVVKLIREKDGDTMARTLRECLIDLSEKYTYALTRYNKDMAILHHTEGVNVDKWIKATDKWHLYLIRAMDDMFRYINLIADELGLKEKWMEEANARPENGDSLEPEQMQLEAERMRIERIADGRGTND